MCSWPFLFDEGFKFALFLSAFEVMHHHHCFLTGEFRGQNRGRQGIIQQLGHIRYKSQESPELWSPLGMVWEDCRRSRSSTTSADGAAARQLRENFTAS